MWPFNRKPQTPAPSGPQPVPAPVIRRDWAGLPPIQRSIGEHPLTAPSDRFSDDLVTHQDPSVSSDRMGHQLSAEAPPGLVLALVTPTTRSDGPAMIPRPRVQRRVDGAAAESGEWDGDEAAPVEARSSPIPATAQRTAIVERPVVTPVVDQPLLTALAPDVDPIPVISQPRRAAAPLTFEAPAASRSDASDMPVSQPAPRLTLGQARKLGLGAPIHKVPDRPVQRSAIEPAPPPSSAAEPIAAPVWTPTNVAQSSVLPLAPARPPIDPLRDPAAADRPATSSPVVPDAPGKVVGAVEPSAISDAAAPTVQRVSDAATQPQLGPAGVAARDLAEVGSLPLRPRVATDPPRAMPATIPMVTTTSMAAADQTAMSAPAALPIAPLVGVRSIATLQRSADTTAPAADGRGAPTAAEPADPEDLDLALSDEPMRRELASFTGDPLKAVSPLPIQRLAVDAVNQMPAATLTLPTRPRETMASRNGEWPALANSSAQTNFHPRSFTPELGPFPLAPGPVIIQRVAADESPQAVDWTSTMTTAAPLQRRLDGEAAPAEAPPALPGMTGATSAAAAAAPAAATGMPAEVDMDALAGRLYDRIRSRLKTELLVDRERAGFLTDLR